MRQDFATHGALPNQMYSPPAVMAVAYFNVLPYSHISYEMILVMCYQVMDFWISLWEPPAHKRATNEKVREFSYCVDSEFVGGRIWQLKVVVFRF